MRILLLCLAALAAAACSSTEDDIKAVVSRDHLDPAATQFREIRQCTADPLVWSGSYNSKNAYGAYVGFKPFLYVNHAAVTAESTDSARQFDALMRRCYGDLYEGFDEDTLQTIEGSAAP